MSDFTFRLATTDDCPIIEYHRRQMFLDMGAFSSDQLEAIREAYIQWVKEQIQNDLYLGVLVEIDGDVIAGGGLSIRNNPPSPIDGLTRHGYVYNVYVAPDYRRRGLARQIMERILELAKEQGITTVKLNASQFGRPLYESMGFTNTTEMSIQL